MVREKRKEGKVGGVGGRNRRHKTKKFKSRENNNNVEKEERDTVLEVKGGRENWYAREGTNYRRGGVYTRLRLVSQRKGND